MRFGAVPVDEAEGAILAHSIAEGVSRLRKGRRLSAADVRALRSAGVASVIGARLAPGDLVEDAAASTIAAAMRFRGVERKPAATGRANLHANAAGVFTVNAALVNAINRVDPAVTIATLPDHAAVARDGMVATVKIIPFAVAKATMDAVGSLLASEELLAVHPFRAARIALIQTELPHLKRSVLDKTTRVMTARLARSGSRLGEERRVAHEAAAVAEAIQALEADHDLVVIFGASAMSDFADVVPAAILTAGGTIVRAGMPVDPGNLLVLGDLGGRPVIGAPGCARSPKENGFDWVLDRLLAGLDVTDADIAGMGVGGLLTEIPNRPQPRDIEPVRSQGGVGIVLLAAGRSRRMGGPNKLAALFKGEPLIRRVARQALASRADMTVVVTGHQAERIEASLAGLGVETVHNPDFALGFSSSLKAGIASLPEAIAGALIVLGDMPDITAADLDAMLAAFRAAEGRSIVRATHNGKRGNPVLLPRSLFEKAMTLEGDTGARHLVENAGEAILDVELGTRADVDVDTPEAMERAGGILQD